MFGRGDKVQHLTKFCLVRHLVQQLQQLHIVRLLSEMQGKQLIYCRFDQKRVVDGDGANVLLRDETGIMCTAEMSLAEAWKNTVHQPFYTSRADRAG